MQFDGNNGCLRDPVIDRSAGVTVRAQQALTVTLGLTLGCLGVMGTDMGKMDV